MAEPVPKDQKLRAGHFYIALQAIRAVTGRPGKSVITAIGVALGVSVFLVTLGWSQTVGAQINTTFDRLSATELRLRNLDPTVEAAPLPDDFQSKVEALPNVRAAGRIALILKESSVARFVGDPAPLSLSVIAVDPGTLEAAEVEMASGRSLTASDIANRLPVALLGPSAAKSVGISDADGTVSVWLDGIPMIVGGVLKSSGSAQELSASVIIPFGVMTPTPSETSAIIRTEVGAAEAIAAAVPLTVHPQNPEVVGVIVPPEATKLREDVQESLNGLAFGGAMFSLLIGGVGIMNSMLTAVTQRASEIGLRRALGARPRHVLGQFVLEGLLLGTLGAFIGTAGGCIALWVVALANRWTPVLDSRILILALAAGALTGLLASIYPALSAARMRPADTLRQ